MTDVQKKLGVTVDATSLDFANLVNAISVVQSELDIMGTTSLEAKKTITGSLNAMKASWQNLLTGVADDTQDFDKLISQFVGTVETFGENILPRVETALNGMADLIGALMPEIMAKIPEIITTTLPKLVTAAVGIVNSLVMGIRDNQDELIDTAFEIMETLMNALVDLLPVLIPVALEIITELAIRLVDFAPELITAAITIVETLAAYFLLPENLAKLIGVGYKLVLEIISGIVSAGVQLLRTAIRLAGDLWNRFMGTDWSRLGKNIVDGLANGFSNAWASFKKSVEKKFTDLLDTTKKKLGIHSPSRVFAGIGKNMALGMDVGWSDEIGKVKKDIGDSLEFGESEIGISASTFGGSSAKFGDSSVKNFGDININIDGGNYQNVYELADAVAYRMQMILDSKGAVYA